ncbi:MULTISPECIES: hypothetical protein [unclassified Mesorhizobium]|uniref:hypothetical protein n=1 Tax=unclassified Mesorhizobium TaxID=325217 RepID=UPI001AEEB265|nr:MULTISPECIES: hypothetical protein [unclassified Mesorhizobium]MCA0013375.1 hypothetical protein [Mesorhizobium sp. B294B1A1]
MLQRHLGNCNLAALDRERLIRFGRDRAAQGAGPMTLGIDIGFIKLVLTHAAAVHGLPVKVEAVDLARIALKRLGLGLEDNPLNEIGLYFEGQDLATSCSEI